MCRYVCRRQVLLGLSASGRPSLQRHAFALVRPAGAVLVARCRGLSTDASGGGLLRSYHHVMGLLKKFANGMQGLLSDGKVSGRIWTD
jgi:hypothetical protein